MGNRQMKMEKLNDTNINNILSQELLSTVLQHIPPKDLIRKCSLVCVLWNQVIHSKGFWVEIAHKRFGESLKTNIFKDPKELQMLVIQPFENLIKNPLALSKYLILNVFPKK